MHFTADRLVENLKALNAKERDHFMRFAYLGATNPYDGTVDRWLSTEMTQALRPLTGLSNTDATRCIFAGMDYHLDWLYAALTLTCQGKYIPNNAKDTQDEETMEVRKGWQSLAELDLDGDINPDAVESLRTVNGRIEDVDLLVVFAEGGKVVVLLVEAKGVASVNKKQLARKVVRLDRILESSGVGKCAELLTCKCVLVAPNRPKPKRPASSDEFWPPNLRELAGDFRDTELRDIFLGELHAKGLGTAEFNFVPLACFPKKSSLGKVTRIKIKDEPRVYEAWKIAKR